jgi:hypothetical protein
MGRSSPPLSIREVHGHPTGLSFPQQRSTIALSHAVQWGDLCHVFRGQFGGRPIVAKICSDRADRAEWPLREEYAVYKTLRDLQGSAIPRCYGLFKVGDFADMLLLEDCGESLQSYDGLTPQQRCVPSLHHAGTPITDRSQGVSFIPRLRDSLSPHLSPRSRTSKHRHVYVGAAEGCGF